MNRNMPQITFQKAVFYIAKDGLLEGKRWHIGKALTANALQTCSRMGYKLSFTPLPGKCIPAVTSLLRRIYSTYSFLILAASRGFVS